MASKRKVYVVGVGMTKVRKFHGCFVMAIFFFYW